jgi:hypothetical protein
LVFVVWGVCRGGGGGRGSLQNRSKHCGGTGLPGQHCIRDTTNIEEDQ